MSEAPLEIRQTREFTQAEVGALTLRWHSLIWRDGAGVAFNTAVYLSYAFGGFLTLSIIMAVQHLGSHDTNLSLQLAVAAIGFGCAFAFLYWAERRAGTTVMLKTPRVGTHPSIGVHGLEAQRGGIRFSVAWSAIDTITNTAEAAIVLLDSSNPIFIVKGAFDDQKADRFCAELTRRWQASRGTASAQ